ncbi:MAG: hypothetical protein ABIO16_11260 [Nocardioides sp.]
MVITKWWGQLTLGAIIGTAMMVYLTAFAFTIAIVIGGMLAWASLKSDGDDAMTALAAGYLAGVIGAGLFQVAAFVFHAPFA